ncbi:UNVERIFIED_CONTAM: hypothetical protein GTU68_024967 [Idotea baltica]|nr:hypothetical protein [Idotea baltica]
MYLFKPRPGEQHPGHSYYRQLYPKILQDIRTIEANWRLGRHNLQRINCRSENSKGVYCLQYDDQKIVSGLRDNTIKIWDRNSLQCYKVGMTYLDGKPFLKLKGFSLVYKSKFLAKEIVNFFNFFS